MAVKVALFMNLNITEGAHPTLLTDRAFLRPDERRGLRILLTVSRLCILLFAFCSGATEIPLLFMSDHFSRWTEARTQKCLINVALVDVDFDRKTSSNR